jgi:hypothetical protein
MVPQGTWSTVVLPNGLLLGGGRISPLSRICLRSPSAQLLDDEKKVHPMSPEEPERNVRDYCDDFTFQAVQELL